MPRAGAAQDESSSLHAEERRFGYHVAPIAATAQKVERGLNVGVIPRHLLQFGSERRFRRPHPAAVVQEEAERICCGRRHQLALLALLLPDFRSRHGPEQRAEDRPEAGSRLTVVPAAKHTPDLPGRRWHGGQCSGGPKLLEELPEELEALPLSAVVG